MSTDFNNNNKYNKIDDVEKLKKQILSDQEEHIEKQIQPTGIHYEDVLIDDEHDLKSKILNCGFADFVIKTIKKTVKREQDIDRQSDDRHTIRQTDRQI